MKGSKAFFTTLANSFGKLVELEFPVGKDTMTSSRDNWRPAFNKALAGCSETKPMKMWFRGLNKDYTPSKTKATKAKTSKARRLSALSERFHRVREFQASTEM